MNCPICNVPLNITERQGVEIDFCPKCRGVWLDRGELDKIIERSMTEMPARTYGESRYDDRRGQRYGDHYDKHYDKHLDDPHEKKKSFLHDLFD